MPSSAASGHRRRRDFLLILLIGLGTVGFMLAWIRNTTPVVAWESGWNGNESSVLRALKKYARAQADFRDHDRDLDGKKNYWRKDIAGLYALKNAEGHPIRLIDLDLAYADAKAVTTPASDGVPSWKAGYWYKVLRFEGETTPDPDRFAACAYPDQPSAGRWVYIVSDKNIIYRKSCPNGQPPDFFPDDPGPKGWEKEGWPRQGPKLDDN